MIVCRHISSLSILLGCMFQLLTSPSFSGDTQQQSQFLYKAHFNGCTGEKQCTDECWGINLNGNTGYRWDVSSAGGKQDIFVRVASPSDVRTMTLWVNNEQVGELTTNHLEAPRPIGKELGPFDVDLISGLNTIEIRDTEPSPEFDVLYLKVLSPDHSVPSVELIAHQTTTFSRPQSCASFMNVKSVDDENCIVSVDMDLDGILDHADFCPDTQQGQTTNRLGCSQQQREVLKSFGDVKLEATSNKACLAVESDEKAQGALIQAKDCNVGNSNVWRLTHVGNNAFNLLNVNAGRLLDVSAGKDHNALLGATHVRCNSNYWILDKQSDETLQLKSLDNLSMCLDTQNSEDSNNNVYVKRCNGDSTQRFRLKQAKPDDTPCWAGPSPGLDIARQPYWPEVKMVEPLDILQEPAVSGDSFFILEKAGRVLKLESDPKSKNYTVFFHLDNVWTKGEAGLASMVFDPQYGIANRYIYLTYVSDKPRALRLSRFTANRQGTRVDVSTEKILFEFSVLSPYHNSGALAFGPGPKDGVDYLYLSMGDDGCLCKDDLNLLKVPKHNFPHGKIMRLQPEEFRSESTLPWSWEEGSDNHYIIASGLRNPWRMSFIDDDLWISNVGSDHIEEIHRFNVKNEIGANFGWPWCEGSQCCQKGSQCDFPGLKPKPNNLTAPIFEYYRRDGPSETSAVIAGYEYNGNLLPQLKGKFLWADYSDNEIYALDPSKPERKAILSNAGGVADFGVRHDGEIFYVDQLAGKAYMLGPGNKTTDDWPPTSLAELGCFESLNNGQPIPASNVHSFEVAHAFWSDGARKERFIAIPKGTFIDASDTNNYVIPPGAVSLKNFYWQNKIFETRIFVRHTGGEYAGYTYRWDSPNSAYLVSKEGEVKELSGLTWHYPSRSQCLVCHNYAVGHSIALEARQLNIHDQLSKLTELSLFKALPESATAFADLNDQHANIRHKALSYLHVNCANCHRGDESAAGRSSWDARYITPLDKKSACRQEPIERFSKKLDEQIISPGAHQLSAVWLRAQQREVKYMPPLGSKIPDEAGMALLSSWIDSLESCEPLSDLR